MIFCWQKNTRSTYAVSSLLESIIQNSVSKGGNHHEDPALLFSLTSSRIDSIRTLQYLVIKVYCCSSSMSRTVLIFVFGRESDIPMSRESFWRLLHRAFIKYLAPAALYKSLCLPVKIGDGSDKGFHRAYRVDPGTAEGTADPLFEFCASLVIEKCHDDIVILLADKIELTLQCNPIMVRRKGAVRRCCHTVFDPPVGDELCDGAPPFPGLVVNVPITIALDR